MTRAGLISWIPRRAVFRQYGVHEWPRVLRAARVRWRAGAQRSYSEEHEIFSRALDGGWSLEKDGTRSRVGVRDSAVGDVKVWLRRGTSDFAVFRQCLLDRHYRLVSHVASRCFPSLASWSIVDGGANIGLSALYFGRIFPGCRLWCLEPDSANRALCRANLDANGLEQVGVFGDALWSGRARLSLRGDFRDGRSWSRAVGPPDSSSDTSGVQGIGVFELLERVGAGSLDLLKLDIEGAEEAVFADPQDVATWLPRVSMMAIEIHSRRARDLVTRELERHGFRFVEHGELLIAVRNADPGQLLAALEDAAHEGPP